MLNAAAPRPEAISRRTVPGASMSFVQVSEKGGRGRSARVTSGLRASCFHRAITFSTMVTTAAPWMTLIRVSVLKSLSSQPNISELTTMPASSMT